MIYLLFAILGFLLLILIILTRILNSILRLNKFLNLSRKALGIDGVTENDIILEKLISEQNINGAIKRYRLQTGADLKEASDYINTRISK